MWPFKKKKNKTDTIIMIRYTLETWKDLYPDTSQKEWEIANCPSDISRFVRNSIVKNATLLNAEAKNAIIATIDNKYLEWLDQNKKTHSTKTLKDYLTRHIYDTDYWSERLAESKMITTYNVLGVPSSVMLHNIEGASTEYSLSKETTDKIVEILKKTYDSNKVFVPGWILKGCDMPICTNDLIQLADLFWTDGTRARLGMFLEQRYSRNELVDKFTPLYFTVPFVVKEKIMSSVVNLSGMNFAEDDRTVQAMAAIRFSDEDRINLFNLITKDVPQVISVGQRAIVPGQAYLAYKAGINKNRNIAPNVSMY